MATGTATLNFSDSRDSLEQRQDDHRVVEPTQCSLFRPDILVDKCRGPKLNEKRKSADSLCNYPTMTAVSLCYLLQINVKKSFHSVKAVWVSPVIFKSAFQFLIEQFQRRLQIGRTFSPK